MGEVYRARDPKLNRDVALKIRFVISPPDGWMFDARLTFAPLAVSPDGRRLVFQVRGRDGKSLLAVRSLDAVASQALAGTDGAQRPFWSPDGRFIGFLADGKLKKIEMTGGPPVTVCETAGATGSAAWSPTGVIVFSRSTAGGPLMKVAATGGMPTAATVLGKDETSHAGRLQFLPDGRHFFYSGGTVQPAGTTTTRPIYVSALDSTERRLMSTEWANALYADGYVLFPREAMLMAQPFDPTRQITTGDPIAIADQLLRVGQSGVGVFDASEQGVLAYATDTRASSRLLWMDRSGARLGTVGDSGDYGAFSLSPDGTYAAVHVRSEKGPDTWLLDVTRGTRLRVISETVTGNPTWSHDGKTLFFEANRCRDIARQVPFDATTREVLLTDDRIKLPISSSPDTQFLALSVGVPPRTQELWILPLEGERKPYRFQGPGGPYKYGLPIVAAFSPDSRWIAYESGETGGNEVFVSAFPGPGDKVRVSAAGGSVPRWRSDGRELFYATPDG